MSNDLISRKALLDEIDWRKKKDPFKKMRGPVERWIRRFGYDILWEIVRYFHPLDAVADTAKGGSMTEEKVNGLLIEFMTKSDMLKYEGKEAEKELAYLAGAYDMARAIKIALKESDGDT